MKKRILSFVLVIGMLMSLTISLPVMVSAETSGIYTYTITDGEAIITDCNTAASGDIVVPSTLGGYPVTAIGDSAFGYCEGIESIILPESVTNISDFAFCSCTSLESITIPDGITSISDGAFFCCDSLAGITIPDGVTDIGDSAFENCGNLANITIPVSVITIGDFVFSGCNNLTDVYYGGTEDEWENVGIGMYNTALTNANIHCVPSILLGDANGDGEVDFADAIAVLKHDAGLLIISPDKITAADVNYDGEVDFVDAIQILKYDSGLISSL